MKGDMNMELKILEHDNFGEIRTTVDEKGNVLFCGADVAKILGYKNPNDAVSRHCRCIVKHDTPHPQSRNSKIEMLFISEPDVYRLVTKSKLPSAVEFERWVFEDVLPSLRKHGMYASDELLNDPELLLATVEEIREQNVLIDLLEEQNGLLKNQTCLLKEKSNTLEEMNGVLKDIVHSSKPLLSYLDTIINSDLDMTATQIAADYGISAIRLNNLLHEAGIQRKVNGQWVLYREYMNMGLTSSITGFLEKRKHFYVQTRWTQQGRLLIHQIMKEAGIDAVGYEREKGKIENE